MKKVLCLLVTLALTVPALTQEGATQETKAQESTPQQAAPPAAAATPAAPSEPAKPAPAGEEEGKAVDRLKAAGDVLEEIQSAPDQGIPEEILGSAECVAVVPSLLKGGFIVGARYGRGVASCRNPKGWTAPAFFTVQGGSFGLQIGGQAVDLVMLIMNEKGMKNLLSSKFELGADASVAAGPVGRHAEGGTDWKLRAQVLTYSRARGVFAGLTLNGAVVKQDKDSTREFYGRMVPFRTSLTGAIEAPKGAYPFLSTLSKWAQTAAK
jgi:lipid-binding SYLF domain-containing protein